MPVLCRVSSMVCAQRRLHLARQLRQIADREQPDAVLHHLLELRREIVPEEAHERGHLVARPLPVLGRERVEAQVRNAETPRRLDDLLHRLLAAPVARNARQAALGRPAPVAVHDDGHVAWQPVFVDLVSAIRRP